MSRNLSLALVVLDTVVPQEDIDQGLIDNVCIYEIKANAKSPS